RQIDRREPFDSITVAVDSGASAVLWVFAHDTVGPRIRGVDPVDSVAFRVQFTAALDPRRPLDTAAVRVFALPDTTPVAVRALFPQKPPACSPPPCRSPPPPPGHHPRAARLHQAAMSDPRRRLPAVEALLAERDIAALLATHPRSLVLRAVRETIDAARADGGTVPLEGWGAAVRARAYRLAAPSLGPVINATGVVLHTNLGRAPLAATAIAALRRVAGEYAKLEYDVGRGTRGSRHALCRGLLLALTRAA